MIIGITQLRYAGVRGEKDREVAAIPHCFTSGLLGEGALRTFYSPFRIDSSRPRQENICSIKKNPLGTEIQFLF